MGLARNPNPSHAALATGTMVSLVLAGCGPAPESTSSPSPTRQRAVAGSPASPSTAARFLEIAVPAGVVFTHQLADGKLDNIMESDGAGGVCFDYDGDGFLDLYLVNSGPAPEFSDAPPGTPRQPNRLFRNRGNGSFEDVTQRAGVGVHGFGTTAAAADYDNDGDADLLVVNFGGLILYQNQGDGTFRDLTDRAGLTMRQAGVSATFLDVDRDGWLDLFVANYLRFDRQIKPPPGANIPYAGPLAFEPEYNLLYRNRGDGTFADISQAAGIRIPGHRAMSAAPLDYDRDGDQDLYVSNDATANLLLANDGHGRFQDLGLQSGSAYNQFGTADGSMGAAVGDANGDQLPDMFVTRFGNASLYFNAPGGFFEDRIQASGILETSAKYTGWGGNWLDFDNDSDLDLFIANGHAHFLQGMPLLLFENRGAAAFDEVGRRAGPGFQSPLNARGSGAFDFDNDGRLDLLVTTLGDRAHLLHNQTPASNHWVKFLLVGTRSNRDAFGARVRVTAGNRVFEAEARCPTSYVFQQDPRLHFGLGSARQVDRVEVLWPGGATQTLTQVPVDQVVRIVEP